MKKRPQILIIDDEMGLCDLVKLILKQDSLKTDCAFSLREGKRKWRDQVPDIVLSDQNLPDGSGTDLIEYDTSLLCKSKIIMTTADTQPETKTKARAVGIAHSVVSGDIFRIIA